MIGARPLVVAGQQVERVASIGSPLPSRREHERADQVPGRLGDERGAVPVLLRVAAGGVQRVPGRGRVAAVLIHLPDLVGDRLEQVACRRSSASTSDGAQPRTAS